ncbi:MAG TPA: hypothetical protein VKR31_00785 [Rhizomicrobium sp.]|nr:hypothetical protein [Rhizomicrobium sp.]
MAKVKVSPEILADALFGYTERPVEVLGAQFLAGLGNPVIEFEIVGPDVPEIDEVSAICNVQQNRAGQRFVKMHFEPVK